MKRFAFVLLSLLTGCGGAAIFTAIGTQMANPLTIAVDSAAARAYVVNSNNKILFTGGSLHVVNIADPANPQRVGDPVALDSLSGQVVLDVPRQLAFIPNRLSENVEDKSDHVVRVDLATSVSTQLDADGDPFGAAAFAAQNRLLVATREGILNFYDVTAAAPAPGQVDLKRELSDGGTLSTVDAVDLVVVGTQAVISRASGGLLIVNLNELGSAGANPVDYFVSDLASPRGLATDGALVYVANVETDADGNAVPSLLVLNLANIPNDAANTTTTVRDKDDQGLLVATIGTGNNPQQVVVGTTEGFVSNMGDDTVTIFTLATRAKAADISVGDEPFGMAIYSPGGVDTHLLVCNSQANTVSIVNLASRTVVGTYQ
ncbi:MAG: hypothetical protein HYV03_07985 [Deltaproteobacteria bacterium]|nr:hypothetical protein [Deltaproteobacteria bacterium]